jgi:hypothetical protein
MLNAQIVRSAFNRFVMRAVARLQEPHPPRSGAEASGCESLKNLWDLWDEEMARLVESVDNMQYEEAERSAAELIHYDERILRAVNCNEGAAR